MTAIGGLTAEIIGMTTIRTSHAIDAAGPAWAVSSPMAIFAW
jgi:hypothetical protein